MWYYPHDVFWYKKGEMLFICKRCDGLQIEANVSEIDDPSVIPPLKGKGSYWEKPDRITAHVGEDIFNRP